MRAKTTGTKRASVALGAVLLVAACSLGACSPKATDSQEGPSASAEEAQSAQAADGQNPDAATMTGEFSFSMDADCAVCHTVEGESTADAQCLVGTTNHASFTCVQCHDDEAGLADAHSGVAYGDKQPKRLKATEVDSAICLSCHGSYEELAPKTADCTALTDQERHHGQPTRGGGAQRRPCKRHRLPVVP